MKRFGFIFQKFDKENAINKPRFWGSKKPLNLTSFAGKTMSFYDGDGKFEKNVDT